MLIGITGTSGVLGIQLAKYCLKQGHTVRGIDRDEARTKLEGVDVKTVNLTKFDDVVEALKGCQAVIHAAAIPCPGRVPDHETHNNCNAIGMAYGPWQRHYTQFPLTEDEPSGAADAYALSKVICELQAEVICRANPDMTIASMRPSMCIEKYLDSFSDPKVKGCKIDDETISNKTARNECWSWTHTAELADASLKALVQAEWKGHEVFWIIAPRTQLADKGNTSFTTQELVDKYYPNTPVRPGWFDEDKGRGVISCEKAERMLGWKHR
ncbi:hypothetical protein OIO90_006295 [Microbotryomycetes sp. JL221]|nr:hypothetical protein OIO90_006295 [Microbotryomycetes sp. JL221]